MSKLSIDANQATIVAAVDANIHDAFLEGVTTPSGDILAAMQHYDRLSAENQQVARDSFRSVFAATLKAMGYPGLTFTTTYAKPGGGAGVLVFTNGILTAAT